MTTENLVEEVLCEDGETRPLSVCVQDHAGEWQHGEDCVEVNGDWYHTDDIFICYVESADEWYMREDCVLANSGWELASECTLVTGRGWYLTEDTFVCSCCGESGRERDAYNDPDDASVCRGCYDDLVVDCSNCGHAEWAEDSTLDEDGYCERCAERHSTRLIASYSDKSANNLQSETKDKLRFGWELEVEGYESADNAAKYIRQHLPATYCTLKQDGSLGESGVEIVTRPDSIEVHKKMSAPLFADSPGRALSSWNTGRCGMHVHVSRAALSQLQIGKMLCFVNEPSAQAFITKIAGRAPCNWCKVHKKKISGAKLETDRYTALNVTGKHTVEVRIFKGTLAEAGFLKNLEFVQALVSFTSPASRSIADATSHRAFCEWLPKKTYPHLHAFLTAKGFMRRRT